MSETSDRFIFVGGLLKYARLHFTQYEVEALILALSRAWHGRESGPMERNLYQRLHACLARFKGNESDFLEVPLAPELDLQTISEWQSATEAQLDARISETKKDIQVILNEMTERTRQVVEKFKRLRKKREHLRICSCESGPIEECPICSNHLHKAQSIQFAGKADSMDVECWCGYTERVAVWYTKPLKGWDERGWKKLIHAITLFLETYEEEENEPTHPTDA